MALPAISAARVDATSRGPRWRRSATNARIEGRVGAARGVGRERAGDERGAKDAFDLEEARERMGGRELRAVEEREPLLRAEFAGPSPARSSAADAGSDLAAEARLADADHRRRHMGERGEIARRADRALRRHDRRDAARKHRFEERERRRPHARRALRQRAELQRHHEPRRGDGRRLADAGCVRQHDVALELDEIRVGDADAGELAEAGVHPIDRLAAGDDALDRRRAGGDAQGALGIERHAAAGMDGAPVGERGGAGDQANCHRPLQMRACSGLKPRP